MAGLAGGFPCRPKVLSATLLCILIVDEVSSYVN
jgi:hypothetical protein